MSSTEWQGGEEDVERVDPEETGAVPPGSADEEGEGGAGDLGSEVGGWTSEGGGGLGTEGDIGGGGMTGGGLGTEEDVGAGDRPEEDEEMP